MMVYRDTGRPEGDRKGPHPTQPRSRLYYDYDMKYKRS
jgi:hypothetical protein